VEIEAKFLVADEETLTRLEVADELASFQLLPGRLLEVRDVYLDTDDRRLLAAGYALRKRRQNGNYLLTFKGLSALEGAVHRRREFEAQLPEDAPQERWPSEEMRELLDRIAKGQELLPIVVLNQTRTVRPIRKGGTVVAELSLDRVRFSEGDKQQRLFELEIELKGQGTDEDLRALVGALASHWPVQPEPYSKLERALALLSKRAESEVVLSTEERMALQAWAGRPNRKSRRAVALLALSEGMSRESAAAKSRLSVRSVRYWLGRFKRQRLGIFPPTPAPDRPVTGGKGAKRKRRSLSRCRKDAPRPLQATPAPEGGEAQPTLPTALGVTIDDSMAEAARKTMFFHLQRMIYHERGTRNGLDVEALHDMRVATRRLRRVWRSARLHADGVIPQRSASHRQSTR